MKKIKKRMAYGRGTTMNLPKLEIENEKKVWGSYASIPQMVKKTGYTQSAFSKWIRQKKTEAWLYKGIIVIKKDSQIPPSILPKSLQRKKSHFFLTKGH